MIFQSPLYRASLIQRISLVLVEACLENGEIVTAYCPNTTRMKTLDAPKTEIFLSYNPKPNRRLMYTWELSYVNGTKICINLGRCTDLVLEAIETGTLYELGGYEKAERIIPPMESPFLDIKLTPLADSGYPVCKVGIAPAYLKKGMDVLYPDGVNVSARHVLKQLEQALIIGERSVLLLLVPRIDCLGVRADWTADPTYVTALKELYDKGLEIICCGCTVSEQEIWVTAILPFSF